MIIIKFMGGIGNQLFQYAFYLFCKNEGKQVEADLHFYNLVDCHGGYLLDKLLPSNEVKETLESVRIYETPNNIYEKTVKKTMHHIGTRYYNELYFKSPSKLIYTLNELNNSYMEGYWQYSEIAISVLDIINSQKIDIKNVAEKKQLELLDRIKGTNSVSLHVRRGDYLKSTTNIKLYGNICTEKYYAMAVEEAQKRVFRPTFYVFSDDIDYCKALFHGNNFVFIPSATPDNAYIDMLLMSECSHHILANSTFSWWGTMLDEDWGKSVIIMPQKFENSEHINYRIIPNSIVIDRKGIIVVDNNESCNNLEK